ncbi:MAG: radical SAM protein [Candidatus Omnitrophica bacterium]|nr:radical SAM protein [Candidatus Omnitrophota bacterium]
MEKSLFEIVKNKYPYVLENFYQTIKDSKYLGFSLFKRNQNFTFRLAKDIRNKFPDKKIIFGGPQMLFFKESLLRDSFKVTGEGEIPFLEIIRGSDKKNYEFKELDNLDELCFCDFSSTGLNSYSRVIPLLSSRGCPHKCNFCSERLLYKKFRHHSPEYMFEQIKFLKSEHLINNFVFCDSLINYSRRWLETLCNLLIKHRLNINWEAQMRVEDKFPLGLARLIKQSGCYNLFVGLESGSDTTLKNLNKGFSAATASEFIATLKKAELHFEISLIFGHPGENNKSFKETLVFIKQNKTNIPKIAQANPFVDYLGTFPGEYFPNQQAKKRINLFLRMIKEERIPYTKSFINNLVY